MFVARIMAVYRLGLANIARVGTYRLLLRAGLHPVQNISPAPIAEGPYFGNGSEPRCLRPPEAWGERANYFGWFRPTIPTGAPQWHLNPFTGQVAGRADAEWWRIPDFDLGVGDVKAIWEASRFDWVLNLAQRASAGSPEALNQLNAWLQDWSQRNPCYRGHNWKCAQEASIRVMHLALAALVLGETRDPRPSLVSLVEAHLRRIAPTLSYARAQDNNHATSEAVALFVGGSWLEATGVPMGAHWSSKGRALLEHLAVRLFQRDGSFSQYSVNYHRLALDTLCVAEIFRRHFDLAGFSDRLRRRSVAATKWLRVMVNPTSGAVPNYGANDGANLLPLTDADSGDFRPAVALATALFEDQVAWGQPGPWQDHLRWLNVTPSTVQSLPRSSAVFRDGGQALLCSGLAQVLFTFPHYRFRPGHCDALHVDLTVRGENLLRDAGTYSYAAEADWQDAFAGIAGHNTIQFDGRDQMPRLGRFLRGPLLNDGLVGPVVEVGESITLAAGYRDAKGAFHHRQVTVDPGQLMIRDLVRGFRSRAVLRWRLRPGEWKVEGSSVTDGQDRLVVIADVPILRRVLVEGWESTHYLRKTRIPVLEVEIAEPGTLTTRYQWSR